MIMINDNNNNSPDSPAVGRIGSGMQGNDDTMCSQTKLLVFRKITCSGQPARVAWQYAQSAC